MNSSTQMPRYIDGVSMGASITGQWINCRGLSSLGFQVVFTGTPTGTWAAEVSYDGPTKNDTGREVPSGNLDATPIAATAAMTAANPAGAGGEAEFKFTDLVAPWFRLLYTRSGGTGTLKAGMTGKGF